MASVGRHRRRASEGMTGMRECPRDPTGTCAEDNNIVMHMGIVIDNLGFRRSQRLQRLASSILRYGHFVDEFAPPLIRVF